jgi:hypothetical protein
MFMRLYEGAYPALMPVHSGDVDRGPSGQLLAKGRRSASIITPDWAIISNDSEG